mmetsp:Transcript_11363/g.25858  ORF Transcript_11363/g.25858 Transcript_11363/m.25858 type:complete len:297 (-) Transcript_11363:47-937(-)|eukprot:CAMPEP_0114546078 /NCGR_PEP_ID=MMETSP0114-20121206/3747_1 /TAXON_ID=31324 /ORGANISM="Goniomonas sp, Strain m" /LENGTH=296 /DNA_ID=CAMNT_0001730559 /DNA_START=14 /DNA_END=904 /DNA_ORIENTATION=-
MSVAAIRKFSLIGAGNMGTTIMGAVMRAHKMAPSVFTCTRPSWEPIADLKQKFPGINILSDNAEASKDADVIMLGVKPNDFDEIGPIINENCREDTIFISMLAGVTIKSFKEKMPRIKSIVRCMPNTPAQIGKGVVAFACTQETSDDHRAIAQSIFDACGKSVYMAKEAYIDMSVVLSGSVPAFYFVVLESLVDAGVHIGMPRQQAFDLASEALAGSAAYAIHAHTVDKVSLAELKGNVTSAGGSTASALFKAEQLGLRSLVAECAWAGYRRALEIAQDRGTVYGPGVWIPRRKED